MPAAIAALRAGATSSLPSAEMMIALTFWVVRSVMNGIWRSAFGLVRADLGDRAAELAGRLVDAGLGGGEVLVDDVLRQVADGDRRRRRRRMRRRRRRTPCRRGGRAAAVGAAVGAAVARAAARACRERDRRDADEGDRSPG